MIFLAVLIIGFNRAECSAGALWLGGHLAREDTELCCCAINMQISGGTVVHFCAFASCSEADLEINEGTVSSMTLNLRANLLYGQDGSCVQSLQSVMLLVRKLLLVPGVFVIPWSKETTLPVRVVLRFSAQCFGKQKYSSVEKAAVLARPGELVLVWLTEFFSKILFL